MHNRQLSRRRIQEANFQLEQLDYAKGRGQLGDRSLETKPGRLMAHVFNSLF